MFLILSSDNWVNFFMFGIIQKQNDKRTAKNDWTAKDSQASFECTMCPWRGVGPQCSPLIDYQYELLGSCEMYPRMHIMVWYLKGPKPVHHRVWNFDFDPIAELSAKPWLAGHPALGPAACQPVWDLTSPLHRLVDVGGPPQESAIRISNSTCPKTPKKNPKIHISRGPPREKAWLSQRKTKAL